MIDPFEIEIHLDPSAEEFSSTQVDIPILPDADLGDYVVRVSVNSGICPEQAFQIPVTFVMLSQEEQAELLSELRAGTSGMPEDMAKAYKRVLIYAEESRAEAERAASQRRLLIFSGIGAAVIVVSAVTVWILVRNKKKTQTKK